jgi:nucleoside-diphosphate-sugar epimerase
MKKSNDYIWVSGASGFIGRHLVRELLKQGRKVRAYDIVPCPESLCSNKAIDWVQGDIADKFAVKMSLDGCAAVFHLAAMVGDWGAVAKHQKITVGGTQNVFESLHELDSKVPIVLSSSIVVYGHQIGRMRCHEALPHGKSYGRYGDSKQSQERLAQSFIQAGLDIRIVRPANVYGAGSKPWVEILSAQLQTGLPSLVSGGDFDAGLVHVNNLVDILIRVSENSGAKGQIYNAADEEGITWLRYMSDIAKICDAPKPISIPWLAAYAFAKMGEASYNLLRIEGRPLITLESLNLIGSSHRIDMEKTKRELGYRTVTSYRDGIEEVAEYLSET